MTPTKERSSMVDELDVFFEFKKIHEYCGYKIVVYQSKIIIKGNRFLITVFNNKERIGRMETNNDIQAVKQIKARIDKSEERGGRLEFIKLS